MVDRASLAGAGGSLTPCSRLNGEWTVAHRTYVFHEATVTDPRPVGRTRPAFLSLKQHSRNRGENARPSSEQKLDVDVSDCPR